MKELTAVITGMPLFSLQGISLPVAMPNVVPRWIGLLGTRKESPDLHIFPLAANAPGQVSIQVGIMFSLIIEIIRTNIILLGQIITAFAKLIYPGKAKDVSGEIVLITGAGSGIGRLMALR